MAMNKRKKAIITGANGFIASHLIKVLKEREIETIPIPRQLLYDLPSLMAFVSDKNPDYVFALHAYGNMANQTEEDKTIMANYFATWNLLKATSFCDYKAFVYISTSSVLLPYETFYSASKAGTERLCKAYFEQYKKPIIIARPFSLFGIGEADFRFIPTVFRSCMTGDPMTLSPQPAHDWLWVDIFIEGILKNVDRIDYEKGRIRNYGTSLSTSNADVVKMIEGITGVKANIIESKQMRNWDNNNWYCKMNSETHLWTTERVLTLHQGLKLIYEFYKKRFRR